MNKEEIKYQFKEFVEDARTEIGYPYDFYEMLRDTLELIDKQETDINKLINYIAVKENKDYEDIRKEFEIW